MSLSNERNVLNNYNSTEVVLDPAGFLPRDFRSLYCLLGMDTLIFLLDDFTETESLEPSRVLGLEDPKRFMTNSILTTTLSSIFVFCLRHWARPPQIAHRHSPH